MASVQSDSHSSCPIRNGLPALGFALLALLGIRTIAHTSVWTHLANGRWIATEGIPRIDTLSFATAEGSRWIAESWLYEWVLFLFWKAGPALPILLHVGAVLVAFALLLPVAKRYAGSTSILCGLLLSAWLVAPVYEVRPSILVLVIPALFIHLLATPHTSRVRWGAVLVGQILWTNSSLTFLMGPVICAAFAIEASRSGKDTEHDGPRSGPLWMMTGAALAVTLLNPYGPLIYQNLVWLLSDPAAGLAREWISPFSALFGSTFAKNLTTAALAVLAGGLLLYRKKLPTALTTVAICGGAFPLLTNQQNLQLFALLGFPFFALSFEAIGLSLKERLNFPAAGRIATAVASLIALISLGTVVTSQYYRSVGSASGFGLGVNQALVPSEADVLLSDPDFPERAMNVVVDGGYLRWAHPERKIFIDSRINLYDANDVSQQLAALRGSPKAYAALIKKFQPQAIILNTTSWPESGSALPFLLQTGDWKLAYFDGTTSILVRNTPELASLAGNLTAQAHGLAVLEAERKQYRERLGRPLGAPISPRILGAAIGFHALQRFNQSAAAYDLVLSHAPAMPTGWLHFGIAHLQAKRVDEAIQALETACKQAKKSATCQLWLSRAYAAAGRSAEAADAYEQATKLNPDEATRFGNPAAN